MGFKKLFNKKVNKEQVVKIDNSKVWCADYGKIIDTPYLFVGISKAKEEKSPSLEYRALWDTGSYITCISLELVKKLGLKPTKIGTKTTSLSGKTRSDSYIVDVYITENMVFENMEVLGTKMSNEMDVIIGMDIISKGNFSITNMNNNTIIQFVKL